jgi:hypothetical protein
MTTHPVNELDDADAPPDAEVRLGATADDRRH